MASDKLRSGAVDKSATRLTFENQLLLSDIVDKNFPFRNSSIKIKSLSVPNQLIDL